MNVHTALHSGTGYEMSIGVSLNISNVTVFGKIYDTINTKSKKDSPFVSNVAFFV